MFIGNEHVHPKSVANTCEPLLSLPYTVFANNVSLYHWWLSVLNHLAKDECNTVQILFCVVWWIVVRAFLCEIHNFFTKTKWFSAGIFLINICATCTDKTMTSISNKWQNCHCLQHLQHHKQKMLQSWWMILYLLEWCRQQTIPYGWSHLTQLRAEWVSQWSIWNQVYLVLSRFSHIKVIGNANDRWWNYY